MPATPFYADTELDHETSAYSFELNGPRDDGEGSVDDLVDVEIEGADAASLTKNSTRRTTDLVRLYLQEIGRVRLLRRDEEVSEAQKVQRYMKLLRLRNNGHLALPWATRWKGHHAVPWTSWWNGHLGGTGILPVSISGRAVCGHLGGTGILVKRASWWNGHLGGTGILPVSISGRAVCPCHSY
ncbi:MAG: hypothetical protein F6K50_01490 [Moorea sp. SIO3I7]|nr:hypothetical protein [Moorena sp. SIO3I7]